MRSHFSASATALVVLLTATGTSAQNSPDQRAALLQRLNECRSVASPEARLACFDAASAALDQAERNGDVVVVERGRIEDARRAIFGFTAPRLPAFLGGPEQSDIESIETTLVSATRNDGWTVRLADGSVWKQTDTAAVSFRPVEGTPVRVRRAAMGSYLMTVGRNPAMRVKRQ
ncbi:hypothetical protein ACFPIF_02855 [Brevundimonas faecalis]|uniref:hypothetical protein n=1 Tax=Brevundimonas faecalis TaxID=947378 RepID=UPI00361A0711